jgi:Fe-S cluster biogenesis protein NfuA
LAHKDLHFFEEAAGEPFHFNVKKLFEKKLAPMFERDYGSEEVRSIIHVYVLTK